MARPVDQERMKLVREQLDKDLDGAKSPRNKKRHRAVFRAEKEMDLQYRAPDHGLAKKIEVLLDSLSIDLAESKTQSIGTADSAEAMEGYNIRPFKGWKLKTPAAGSGWAPFESSGLQEFRAAAASGGKEKPRAVLGSGSDKRLLGRAEGAKGKCSFYAIGDSAFVAFDHGGPPTRITLRGLAPETYALSSEADADGHHEIIGIKTAEVAQFLAMQRKARW